MIKYFREMYFFQISAVCTGVHVYIDATLLFINNSRGESRKIVRLKLGKLPTYPSPNPKFCPK